MVTSDLYHTVLCVSSFSQLKVDIGLLNVTQLFHVTWKYDGRHETVCTLPMHYLCKLAPRHLPPVLLCSASSMAICMRASNTSALSSQLCQSSSSCSSAAVPDASDTFRVASLHSRSIKPGIFNRATADTGDSRWSSSCTHWSYSHS